MVFDGFAHTAADKHCCHCLPQPSLTLFPTGRAELGPCRTLLLGPKSFSINNVVVANMSRARFVSLETSVAFMHARTGAEIYVRPAGDVQTSKDWRLTAALNGIRRASRQWQDASPEINLEPHTPARAVFHPSCIDRISTTPSGSASHPDFQMEWQDEILGKHLETNRTHPPRKPKKGTARFETTSYNRQPHPQPSIRGNFTTCPLDTFIQKACSLSSAGSALANHSVSFVYLYTSSTISLSIGG